MNKSLLSASLFALALAAPLAHAHEAGDIIIRAGAITVNPKADSSSVKVDQGPLSGTNLGGKATMSSDTQLGLNFAYMLTNNVGIELLAATPFEHDVKLKGTALPAANGKLGTLKHLPPTLSVVYYPLDSKSPSSRTSAAASTTPGSTTNTSAAKPAPTVSATSRRKTPGAWPGRSVPTTC
jgi:outer membrane protein